MYDAVIVGGGLSGMAVALLLQSRGRSTVIVESHSRLGGCAGFYPRDGFSFDIGATTLVDFQPGGLGGNFLDEVGVDGPELEFLPGYKAWLPDRTVDVARDPAKWAQERLLKLGDTARHRALWNLLDEIATSYWAATRRGIKMPMRNWSDLHGNWKALDGSAIRLSRYLSWSVGDALKKFSLENETALVGQLSMMVEDTVHAELHSAPLINAALGISIRGAGLARPAGGMRGFWRRLSKRYVELGGKIRLRTHVNCIDGNLGRYVVKGENWSAQAAQVVCALPLQSAVTIAPKCFGRDAHRFVDRDTEVLGGGLVLCLGVPASEVADAHEGHRHHQILQSYDEPLGNGNNMFISVSAADDELSAPSGYRAVMISTHCELNKWTGLTETEYHASKAQAAGRLLTFARRVYPQLGNLAKILELGTPRTYEHFTHRPGGAIGGARLSMKNSNQHAVPYDIGRKGFWLAGDTTWPGLGTVACVLGAKHIADAADSLLNRHRVARSSALPWNPFATPSA